jgi:CRISPR-associated protein Cas2
MAHARMLTVFCYDVSDHKIRRRVARILEDRMVRVQRSVFEAWLTKAETNRLSARINKYLDTGDSLRIYAISQSAMARSKSYGPVPLQNSDNYYLL